jgi:hypothetical protein
VTGDPKPKKRLFSRRSDVTLANPLGPALSVEATLDRVAAWMRDGRPHEFERVSEFTTPELAYVHEIERGRAKLGGSQQSEPSALRATTVWRREAGEWKIGRSDEQPVAHVNDRPGRRLVAVLPTERTGRSFEART